MAKKKELKPYSATVTTAFAIDGKIITPAEPNAKKQRVVKVPEDVPHDVALSLLQRGRLAAGADAPAEAAAAADAGSENA